jgi:hypothetical protein
VNVPAQITAGTTVVWDDFPTTDNFGVQIDATTHTLTYYFRYNEVFAAVTTSASTSGPNWRTTLSSATTGPMAAGTWYFSAVATKISGGTITELGRGSITVTASLAYAGTSSAYDGRTQSQKDLDAVQLAIRTLLSGGSVQEYRIGQRSIKRYDLSELLQLEAKLKADVKREEAAQLMANGLGNPRNMFIRFN